MTRTKLSEDDLDRLLSRGGQTRGARPLVDAAVAAMVTEAPAHVPRRTARAKRLVVVAVGVSVGVALIAGTTMSAVWLQTPPFQELPESWTRTTEFIPLEWVSVAGEAERCRVYLELERARPGDIEALDSAIAAHDWTGFGQALYDSLPHAPTGPDVEGEVGTMAVAPIQDFAVGVIPEVGESTPDGPAVGALATTCRTDI